MNTATHAIAPQRPYFRVRAAALAAVSALLLALALALAAPAPQAHATAVDLGLVQSNATSTTATFTWDAPNTSKYSSQVIGYSLASDSSRTYVDVNLSTTSYTVNLGSEEYCYLYVYLGDSDLSAAAYYNNDAYDYDYVKGYPFDSSKLAKVKAATSSWTNSSSLYVKTDFNAASSGTQINVYAKSGKKLASVTKTYAGTQCLDAAAGKVVKVRQRSYIKLSSGKTLYGTWSNWANFAPSCKVKKISKSGAKLKVKYKKTKGATRYIVRYAYSKKSLTSSDTKKLSKLSWKTQTVSKSKGSVKLPKKKGQYLYVQVLTVSKVDGKTVKAKKSYGATYKCYCI